MILVLHLVVFCRFTYRSYAGHVLPVSYAWSTYTGPVSGEVHQVKPYGDFENSNGETESYNPDYVAKPDYSFAYGVDNPNTGDNHGHSETRDGSTVTGEYTVMEPDGVLRRVQYTADPKNGFRASVRFVRPDGGESSGHDRHYGYRGGERDGSPPDGASAWPPPQPSQGSAEYQPEEDDDDDGPYASQHPSTSSPPFPFDFDGYRDDGDDQNDRFNGNFNDGDYEDDDRGPSRFKFPSSPSSDYKTYETDAGEYDGSNKYYRRFGVLSSPSPFGLPSSPSPSFDLPSSPSPSFDLPSSPSSGPSRSPFVVLPNNRRPPSPPVAQPCVPITVDTVQPHRRRRPPSSTGETVDYQTGHSSGFDKPSADDADDDDLAEPFRSSPDFDGETTDDHVESDDGDADTGVFTTVRPSRSFTPTPRTSTPTPRLSVVMTSTPTPRPSPFRRPPPPSSRPAPSIVIENLSPSSIMIPIEPTIIDIDG